MIIKDIINTIEEWLPKGKAEDFDNVGLLCGNQEREVTGIMVCHDALEAVIDEAIEKNCNLIITFHPIIFSGLKSLTGKNYVERSVIKALENKIAIYAIHTSMDNDYFGVNYRICNELGLINQQVLMPKNKQLLQLTVFVPTDYAETVKNALFKAGAGNIGFYDECSFSIEGKGTFRPMEGSNPFSGTQNIRENADELMISVIFEDYKKYTIINAMKVAHPYEEVAYQIYQLENENHYEGLGRMGELEKELTEEEFLKIVKQKFNLDIIRHSSFRNRPVKTVGVLGGSGASGIKSAFAKGCDAYLTGDIKYHDFFMAESKMLICDIGHYESEQFVVQQINDYLSKKFPKFAIFNTSINTNPVNYF